MKKKNRRKVKRSPRVAIVPSSALRLGSHAVNSPEQLIQDAQVVANILAKILPEKGLVVELAGKNASVPTKRYVKTDGWTIAGAMLGVNPIEESCDPVTAINGYKAVVRLERICDSKVVGRASAICSLDEPASTDFSGEEFATYSKTITRATGKAFRLTYGWLMKLAGFEGTPAEELYEVEGTESASEEVAKRKIEEKLGRKFETLAHAEAAMLEEKEAKKIAKKSVTITWPESHNGHRFLLTGKLPIWENALTQEVEQFCGGVWNDREGGWFIGSDHAPYIRAKILNKGIPIIEPDQRAAS